MHCSEKLSQSLVLHNLKYFKLAELGQKSKENRKYQEKSLEISNVNSAFSYMLFYFPAKYFKGSHVKLELLPSSRFLFIFIRKLFY